MENTKITIKPNPLRGTIQPPPSKSISHRAWILSAFSEPGTVIRNVLDSTDTNATKRALELMGASYNEIEEGYQLVRSATKNTEKIDCMNSGTTLRLLTGIASLFDGKTILSGDDSLITRPMQPLIGALEKLGAIIESNSGKPPIKLVKKIDTEKVRTEISGSTSSQYISSLLILMSLREDQRSEIQIIPPVVSRPYIDLSLLFLKKLGIFIEEIDDTFYVQGVGIVDKFDFTVPSDMSSAAFFIVAGALGENKITLTNIDREFPQADAAIIDVVKSTGAEVQEDGDTLSVSRLGKQLKPFEVDLSQSPDLFPILCVLAAATEGTSRIYNAEHVRVKETDRISVMLENLKIAGVDFEEKPDGAIIHGTGKIDGGVELFSHHDHRIAMASAILAKIAEKPIIISDYDCVDVSYPDFYRHLEQLSQ